MSRIDLWDLYQGKSGRRSFRLAFLLSDLVLLFNRYAVGTEHKGAAYKGVAMMACAGSAEALCGVTRPLSMPWWMHSFSVKGGGMAQVWILVLPSGGVMKNFAALCVEGGVVEELGNGVECKGDVPRSTTHPARAVVKTVAWSVVHNAFDYVAPLPTNLLSL